MATVALEQVTQPYKIGDVSITDGTEETTIGQRLWLSTTTYPTTVVNTKSVAADQDTPAELLTISDTVDAELDDEQVVPGGDDISDQVLVKLGNTTLAADNVGGSIATEDIADFVAGGFGTLHYSIDDASEADFGTSQMAGSVLVYTTTDTDTGADTVLVNVVDDAGEEVQVTCTVTVS